MKKTPALPKHVAKNVKLKATGHTVALEKASTRVHIGGFMNTVQRAQGSKGKAKKSAKAEFIDSRKSLNMRRSSMGKSLTSGQKSGASPHALRSTHGQTATAAHEPRKMISANPLRGTRGVGQLVKYLKKDKASVHAKAADLRQVSKKVGPHSRAVKDATADHHKATSRVAMNQKFVNQVRKKSRGPVSTAGLKVGKKGGRFKFSPTGKKIYLKHH